MKSKLIMCLTLGLCFVFGCPGTTPDPCADITCDTGETCVDGECVADMADPCEGVTCDEGETCVDGECVAQGGGGDAALGETFYMANNCAFCHAADASGGIGPSLVDESSSEIFAKLSGAASHGGGTVADVTQADADNLEAWLSSL